MKAKGDGVRAAMHMAMRFWALPSSQCPGCPRVNAANTHLGTQRATLALLTFGQDPRRNSRRQESRFKVPARLANAHHKTPRGGAVCGEAIAALRHGWLTADPYGVSLVQSQPPARINLPQIESTANKTEGQCHSLPVTVTHSRLLDTRGVSWQ